MSVAETDLFAADRALRAPGLLRAFNDAGVLTAADVHVGLRLARLARETDEDVVPPRWRCADRGWGTSTSTSRPHR
jgi:hypothetical protein